MIKFYFTIFTLIAIAGAILFIRSYHHPPAIKEAAIEVDSAAGIDNIMIGFMEKYSVPGLSLAISKDGELVYAKGYGYADQSTNEKVTPNSLFRIASISKPFTSVAIFQLIEEKKLSLRSKVFGDSGVLGNTYGKRPYAKDITNITIEELLQHTAGGWSNDMNDPMFTNPSMSAAELITWTIDKMPLRSEPGTNYAYSNFGYCVLGRVIEKISGLHYDDYVKKFILKKAGISDMEIGGNTLADRKPNEVIYYSQGGEDPYVFNVKRMDSHGGWIASATDLVKFTLSVDSFTTKPDILSGSSISLMTTPSSVNKNYACGWQVNDKHNWWHGGSLPGTTTEMVRAHNGYCWAILTNTRTWQQGFVQDMDQLVWQVLKDSTIQWRSIEKQ